MSHSSWFIKQNFRKTKSEVMEKLEDLNIFKRLEVISEFLLY